MINNYEFDPCTHPGCGKRTGHYSGKCVEHQNKQCLKRGCKNTFRPLNMNMIYCKEHRKRKRVTDVTIHEDW